MDRRTAVLICGGTLAAPLLAIAQPARTYRVAMVWMAAEPAIRPWERIFVDTLREQGYAVGRNLVYEPRYAEGVAARLPVLIDEAIAGRADVLVGIEQVALIMKGRTATIPIVLANSSDPVGAGLARSLARPEGNVTGVSFQHEELGPKQLELAREIVPRLVRVGEILDRGMAGSKAAEENSRQAAKNLGLAYTAYRVSGKAKLEQALAKVESDRIETLLVAGGSGMLFGFRQLIVEHAARLRIPLIASAPYVEIGALMSYASSLNDGFRLAAEYVARILKGAKPAELPIRQPTKFEMVINLKTAKALGVSVPKSILLRADRVIE